MALMLLPLDTQTKYSAALRCCVSWDDYYGGQCWITWKKATQLNGVSRGLDNKDVKIKSDELRRRRRRLEFELQ